ncbi:ExbD/TolR family protein [Marinicellulosiphila megalodicopiae]|uniref:ExbD/TolR family protein n=1 Tax=Marinicellulosiphila megalodicopiae TaxID=2724896 RepID=UPI003BAF1FA5
MARKLASQTIIEEETAVDLTPMLDVVFIMLIFFIVTASFIKETGVDVRRPESSSANQVQNLSILIAVKENGEVWMDRRRIDIRQVRANIERLRAENPKGSVVIQADGKSTTDVVVKVLDAAREAGVLDASLATSE